MSECKVNKDISRLEITPSKKSQRIPKCAVKKGKEARVIIVNARELKNNRGFTSLDSLREFARTFPNATFLRLDMDGIDSLNGLESMNQIEKLYITRFDDKNITIGNLPVLKEVTLRGKDWTDTTVKLHDLENLKELAIEPVNDWKMPGLTVSLHDLPSFETFDIDYDNTLGVNLDVKRVNQFHFENFPFKFNPDKFGDVTFEDADVPEKFLTDAFSSGKLKVTRGKINRLNFHVSKDVTLSEIPNSEFNLHGWNCIDKFQILNSPSLERVGLFMHYTPYKDSRCIDDERDISLEGAPNIKTLSVEGSFVVDPLGKRVLLSVKGGKNILDTLHPDTKLTSLTLKESNISKLDIDTEGMTSLDMSNNKIESINDIPSSRTLKKLILNDNDLKSIEGILDKFPGIEHVELNGNKIRSMKPLTEKPSKLKHIYIEKNFIKDFQDLGKLEHLNSLKIDGNPLKTFDIEGFTSTDVSVFRGDMMPKKSCNEIEMYVKMNDGKAECLEEMTFEQVKKEDEDYDHGSSGSSLTRRSSKGSRSRSSSSSSSKRKTWKAVPTVGPGGFGIGFVKT